MVARTWMGGGNNYASNSRDWSPSGAPQPGDQLSMYSGGVMTVTGNALAGDTLVLGTYLYNLNPQPYFFVLQNGSLLIDRALPNAGPATYYLPTGYSTLSLNDQGGSFGHTDTVYLGAHTTLFASMNMPDSFDVIGGQNSVVVLSGAQTAALHTVIDFRRSRTGEHKRRNKTGC